MRVFRLFGGAARQWGNSWTVADPRKLPNPRDALGLPDANTAEWLIIGELADHTKVRERRALPLDRNGGGAPELLVLSPEEQIVIIEIVGMELRDE